MMPKPKRRPKKAPDSSTSALDKALAAVMAQTREATASLAQPTPATAKKPPAKPAAPRTPAGISPYPDLAMAISMLQHRSKGAGGERKVLIDKWISQLQKIHTEMHKLRKLEKLTSAITKPQQESLPL